MMDGSLMEDEKMIEENKTIAMLSIDKLYPHPDNPRREVGDVSELADSIRANGIMQNLTVIPKTEDFRIPDTADWEEVYTVLIGHRRLAAAKQAGVYKLPCVIVEGVPRAQQIMIMNGENSQRHDLTKYEEGASYQLMLDLGETIDSIAKGVGFSTATVRRRVEIAKHDRDTMESLSYQITMEVQDAMRKVKNTEEADRILREAKSAENAAVRLDECARKEKEAELAGKICGALKEKGFREMSSDKYYKRRWTDIDTVRTISIDEDAEEELKTVQLHPMEMFVYDRPQWGSGTIKIIKPKDKAEKSEEEKEAESRAKEARVNKKMLASMKDEMVQAFRGYAGRVTERWMKPHCKESDLIARIWESVLECNTTASIRNVKDMLQKNTESLKDYTGDDVKAMPMLYSMLLSLTSYGWAEIADYGGYFYREAADKYRKIYEILQEFDFEMPDPEWLKLLDGSHEAFRKREEG